MATLGGRRQCRYYLMLFVLIQLTVILLYTFHDGIRQTVLRAKVDISQKLVVKPTQSAIERKSKIHPPPSSKAKVETWSDRSILAYRGRGLQIIRESDSDSLTIEANELHSHIRSGKVVLHSSFSELNEEHLIQIPQKRGKNPPGKGNLKVISRSPPRKVQHDRGNAKYDTRTNQISIKAPSSLHNRTPIAIHAKVTPTKPLMAKSTRRNRVGKMSVLSDSRGKVSPVKPTYSRTKVSPVESTDSRTKVSPVESTDSRTKVSPVESTDSRTKVSPVESTHSRTKVSQVKSTDSRTKVSPVESRKFTRRYSRQPGTPGQDAEKEQVKFVAWYTSECEANRLNISYRLRGQSKKLCPCLPKGLGRVSVNPTSPATRVTANNYVNGGDGIWRPRTCVARQQVVVIVPYRDREEHLKLFLAHMHPFLQRQLLTYSILVVEQVSPAVFNRAALMNIGFVEAGRLGDFHCFIFHDVDLLPEDTRNVYTCTTSPRHVAVAVDKFRYQLQYSTIVGGALAMTSGQMLQVNGFSNKFYGWGGEDDDMYNRIRARDLNVVRYPEVIGRYTMLQHGGDDGNPPNPTGGVGLEMRPDEYEVDGLNSLDYQVDKVDHRKLYTHIQVQIKQ